MCLNHVGELTCRVSDFTVGALIIRITTKSRYSEVMNSRSEFLSTRVFFVFFFVFFSNNLGKPTLVSTSSVGKVLSFRET